MGYTDRDILNLALILQTNCINEEYFASDLKAYGTLRHVVEQRKQEERQLRVPPDNVQLTDNQVRYILLAWLSLNLYYTAQKSRAEFPEVRPFSGFTLPID